MQSQLPASVQAARPDTQSLTAAALCVLALFFDLFGWVLAIAGMILEFEFHAARYVEAAKQDKGTVSFPFGWSSQGETGDS